MDAVQDDFDQNSSSILGKVDLLLRQIVSNDCEDLKSLTMIMNFVGNCFEEANPEFADKVIRETCFIQALAFFIENRTRLQPEMLELVIWIVNNVSKKVTSGPQQ